MGQGGKRFLYVVLVLVLTAAALELGTRLLDGSQNDDFDSAETSPGSDESRQFSRDRSECASLGVKYYEYFLFSAAPCATATVNVSDFYSSRRTPASKPADRADLIVWTFGGSTMQEFETTDARSIANVIARTMAAAGVGARVENFGGATFQSSLELVKFMTLAARVPAEQLPGVVVFYDGYNDANHGYYFGAGNMQNDLSAKLAALVEHKSGTLSLYAVSMGLAAHSEFWKTQVHKRLEHALFHDPRPAAGRSQPAPRRSRPRSACCANRCRPRGDRRPLLFRAAAADRDQGAARAGRDPGDRRDEAVADRVRARLLRPDPRCHAGQARIHRRLGGAERASRRHVP
jgi:hypothetical protein